MMIGETYESDVAIYKIVRESKFKWFIERTNKENHPCSPNKTFPICGYWKKATFFDRLKKIEGTCESQ